MGNNNGKLFIDMGKEMAKAAIKVLAESEELPNAESKVRAFVSTVLKLPDNVSEVDLERAISEIDPYDDISTTAEKFIRAASVYVYSQRDVHDVNFDFWIACRECLIRLGVDTSTLETMCVTPTGDKTLESFCKQLSGCELYKTVQSTGAELTLWKITSEALKLLEKYLENNLQQQESRCCSFNTEPIGQMTRPQTAPQTVHHEDYQM